MKFGNCPTEVGGELRVWNGDLLKVARPPDLSTNSPGRVWLWISADRLHRPHPLFGDLRRKGRDRRESFVAKNPVADFRSEFDLVSIISNQASPCVGRTPSF